MTTRSLEPPCQWCGFSGAGYWQPGTHATTCPWYAWGGKAERRRALGYDYPPAAARVDPSPPTLELVLQRLGDFTEGYRAGYAHGLDGEAEDAESAWCRSKVSTELADLAEAAIPGVDPSTLAQLSEKKDDFRSR